MSIRNLIYGMTGALILNLGAGIWWASGLEARVSSLERQQTNFSLSMDRLNDAREKIDNHMTHVDDQVGNVNDKVSAILDIVQRMERGGDDSPAIVVGTPSSGYPASPDLGGGAVPRGNFPKRP